MIPSEGEHVDHFGKFGASPKGKEMLDSKDEEEGTSNETATNKDTIQTDNPTATDETNTNDSNKANDNATTNNLINNNTTTANNEAKEDWYEMNEEESSQDGNPETAATATATATTTVPTTAPTTNETPTTTINPQQSSETNDADESQNQWTDVTQRKKAPKTTAKAPVGQESSEWAMESTVRLEIAGTNNGKQRNYFGEIRDCITAIKMVDSQATILSINECDMIIFSADDIPTNRKGLEEFFHYSQHERDGNIRMIVVFKIKSEFVLEQMKEMEEKLLVNHLRDRDCYLYEHNFEGSPTSKPGFMAMKPPSISCKAYAIGLRQTLFCATGKEVPYFDVVVHKLNENMEGTGASTYVLAILCKTSDLAALNDIFVNTELHDRIHSTYVSFATIRNNPAMHERIFTSHSELLREHWSINVLGLNERLLDGEAYDDEIDYYGPLRNLIELGIEGIRCVDMGRKPGAYTIAVDKECREGAYEYIRNRLQVIVDTSEAFNGEVIQIDDNSLAINNKHEEYLAEKFKSRGKSKPNARRNTKTVDWFATGEIDNSIAEFPLLEQANPLTNNNNRFLQAALQPQRQRQAIATPPTTTTLTALNNTRTARAMQSAAGATQRPTTTHTNQSTTSTQAPQSPVEIIMTDVQTVGRLTQNDDDASLGLTVATLQTTVTELTAALQRQEQIMQQREVKYAKQEKSNQATQVHLKSQQNTLESLQHKLAQLSENQSSTAQQLANQFDNLQIQQQAKDQQRDQGLMQFMQQMAQAQEERDKKLYSMLGSTNVTVNTIEHAPNPPMAPYHTSLAGRQIITRQNESDTSSITTPSHTAAATHTSESTTTHSTVGKRSSTTATEPTIAAPSTPPNQSTKRRNTQGTPMADAPDESAGLDQPVNTAATPPRTNVTEQLYDSDSRGLEKEAHRRFIEERDQHALRNSLLDCNDPEVSAHNLQVHGEMENSFRSPPRGNQSDTSEVTSTDKSKASTGTTNTDTTNTETISTAYSRPKAPNTPKMSQEIRQRHIATAREHLQTIQKSLFGDSGKQITQPSSNQTEQSHTATAPDLCTDVTTECVATDGAILDTSQEAKDSATVSSPRKDE